MVLSAGYDIHLNLQKKELAKIFGVEHHSQGTHIIYDRDNFTVVILSLQWLVRKIIEIKKMISTRRFDSF